MRGDYVRTNYAVQTCSRIPRCAAGRLAATERNQCGATRPLQRAAAIEGPAAASGRRRATHGAGQVGIRPVLGAGEKAASDQRQGGDRSHLEVLPRRLEDWPCDRAG